MTTTETPTRTIFGRSLLTAVIMLLVGCLICAGIAALVVGPAITRVADSLVGTTTVSNDFMNALIAKDYTKAFAMVHASQKESFGGSAEGMQKLLTEGGLQPSSYTFASVHVGEDGIVNGTGTFNGAQKYVIISLRKDGDIWKILGLNVSDNPPTATPGS